MDLGSIDGREGSPATGTSRGREGPLFGVSEGLEHVVAVTKPRLEGVQSFLSDRKRVTLTAASLILVAFLISLLRGWSALRFRHAGRKSRSPHVQTNRGT